MGPWPSGELLGFDLETTGIDRFKDVPVSYALVYAVAGRIRVSWSGLIDPDRDIPEEATAAHGITTEIRRRCTAPRSTRTGDWVQRCDGPRRAHGLVPFDCVWPVAPGA